MRDIEMKFDKNEFALLARLVFIGSIAAEEGLTEEVNEKVDELLDRILQIAHTSKIIDGIAYDEELKKYFTDAETEEFLLEPFDEFVENSFWDELTVRMAQQELIKKIGEKVYLELSVEDRMTQMLEMEESFDKEFEEHGLKNLALKK